MWKTVPHRTEQLAENLMQVDDVKTRPRETGDRDRSKGNGRELL